MGMNSKIEWTDHTWNPWRGCTKVSPGCDNCYMFRDAVRFGLDASIFTRSARQTFISPFSKRYKSGDKVFVCSWSDFFHPAADEWRAEAWDIINTRDDLIFQILTKRPERIIKCLPPDWGEGWPNVWLGVTAENQEQTDERIPRLLSTQAVKRFVSIEPMLGEIRIEQYVQLFGTNFLPEHFNQFGWKYDEWSGGFVGPGIGDPVYASKSGIDWVIVGGETGPNARPMHPDWVRSIRDQCQAAGVSFFFKQWGEWSPGYFEHGNELSYNDICVAQQYEWPEGYASFRVGRRIAGCLLDGREWKEFPE